MSAHPPGLGWDGTGLHAGRAGTHRETGQSDIGDLDKQELAGQPQGRNTGRVPGQPPGMLTCEAWTANAAEAPTWVLQTIPSVCIVAGTRVTLIDVRLTAQTSVPGGAGAAEAPHQVHAGTIVQAPGALVQGWAWATVVLINLTEHTLGRGG